MTTSSRSAARLSILALLLAGALAPRAIASGFQLREQSPSAQGNAFAGVSAGGSDISGMFFNPAILTQFASSEILAGISVVSPTTRLSGGAATSVYGTTLGGPASTDNACSPTALPNLYAMWSLSPDLKVGLSLNAPFGMKTEYDSHFVGRYHALKSDLQIVDLSPTVAYRINHQWSVGASFVARRTQAELTNAVDFGTILHAYGTTSGTLDGSASLEGTKWSYGYKLGAAYQPTEKLKLGLGYQSAIKVKLQGDVTFQLPTLPAQLTAGLQAQGFTAGGIYAEVNLPSTLSLGFDYKLDQAVSLQGEVARTDWSCFKELKINFTDNIAAGKTVQSSTTEEHWNDTWFVALGATWKASQAWTFRTGVALDQGATNDSFRTPRIPDADRKWVSLGAGYAASKHLSFDLAYTHIYVDKGNLDLKAVPAGYTPTTSPNTTKGNLSGTFDSKIDIFAASVRYTF